VIDTHCHLLPAVDDGPRDLREAALLARALFADGVTAVACTPHYSRRFSVEPAEAERLRTELAQLLRGLALPLELTLAAEISSTYAAIKQPEELRARALGGRFLLVELEPATTRATLEALLAGAELAGLTPVLAHPERAASVQADPRLLERVAPQALVQVVAPSLLAGPASRTGRAAWRLLDQGGAHLLASDAHGAEARPPRLRAAAARVALRFGDAAAEALTTAAPRLLLEGRDPRD
jgi:protein-tyrosine phosphatase